MSAPEKYRMISRAALIVKPKQPYVDWVVKRSRERKKPESEIKPEDVIAEGFDTRNVYLIPVFEGKDEFDKYVKENFSEIFEYELEDWLPQPGMWPEKRTWKMFKDWFSYEVHTVVYDTVFHAALEDDDAFFPCPDDSGDFDEIVPFLSELDEELDDLLSDPDKTLLDAENAVIDHLREYIIEEEDEEIPFLGTSELSEIVMDRLISGLEVNNLNLQRLIDYADFAASPCGYGRIFEDFWELLDGKQKKELIKSAKNLYGNYFLRLFGKA